MIISFIGWKAGRLANDGRKESYDQNISLLFFVRALVAYVLFVGRSCSSSPSILSGERLCLHKQYSCICIRSEGEGENNYHNLDFVSSTKVVEWKQYL
jgi:hypothetical protein